ncbi:GntR family transcriptional regulator [Anaerobium acetethylicum]|uniref:DNA-binding transcriptional regulator, GntR family n=1 Tax=Anaerobium acetethylicum TaxID=1619234 RepID=A0A1D3TYQ4_9FIRM|nr:GntR family transcriptional regulator [Anaerobium acetethylicum]SCP99589.1 DNA-binding transcriptional regulator, GntR family [Anaerobium acetethylicum]
MELRIHEKKDKEKNSDYAYRILHGNIMTLQLPPGSVLNENELSDLLQVSRTPIHEAIIRLKSEYLVDVYPQSASMVSLISIDILKEGLFLRSTVEPAIIKQIAGNVSSENLKLLKNNLDRQQNLLDVENNVHAFMKLDDEFHQIMYQLAGKPRTWASVKSINSHYDRARHFDSIHYKTDPTIIYNEHKTIYHLIMMGISSDYDVEQFYSKHLRKFYKNFENLMAQYPDYFIV